MLTLKYQGREQSRNRDESVYKETWQGTEAEVKAYIESNLSTWPLQVQGKGWLTSYRMAQDGGPFWSLEVEYTTQYSRQWENDDDTVVGQKSAQLSVRPIQMPLEHHKNYRAHWNNYMYSKGTAMLPTFYQDATDTKIPANMVDQFMWVKTRGEVPTEPDQNRFTLD